MSNQTTEYEIAANHKSDLLTQDLVLSGLRGVAHFRPLGVSFEFPHVRYEHATGDISYPTHELRELEAVVLTDSQLEAMVRRIEDSLKDFEGFLKRMHLYARFGTDAMAREAALQFIKKAPSVVGNIAYFVFQTGLEKSLSDRKLSVGDLKLKESDTSRASFELNEIASEYREELRLLGASNCSMSKQLSRSLDAYAQRFGYLGMKYFLGHPWTRTEVFQTLSEITTSVPSQKTQKYSTTSFARNASKFLSLRTDIWELMCRGCAEFRQIVTTRFPHLVDYDELLRRRLSEVANILENKPLDKEVASREENFVMDIVEDGVQVEYLSAVPHKEASSVETVSELRGMVAQKGYVCGVVKIVLEPREGSKLQPGEILVTTMSTPDFLPTMQKAAAFITDIGGITSHAAIVSREMEKPCIIGTKIATKVLHDGDEVEVDAEKGIIKILKRA